MIDLFRSENVVVRSVPAADVSRWVVTFDNYGIGHGFDRPGFGEEFLRLSGVSAIHVMGRREDWYQYPEMAEAMAVVKAATVGADRVMTYGSSMGGYAALRFADAAGAHAVLAISPQYSIDPQKTPFETRWLQDSQRICWLPEVDGRIVSEVRPVVVFDPTIEDGRQVARIQEDIDIWPIRLPYASHPATTYLGEIGLLKSLVLQTLSGELDAVSFGREARSRRSKSGLYISTLAMSQPAHRRELAFSLAQRSVAINPGNPLTGLALAKLLSGEGRHDEAIEKFESIVVSTNRAPIYLVPYVDALMAAGRYEEARPYAREVVEAFSHLAHIHAWEGAVLWGAGENVAAIAALERAVVLDPQQPQYGDLLENYRREGRPQIAYGAGLAALISRALSRLRPWRRGQGAVEDVK